MSDTWGVTGHRPQRLGGYGLKVYQRLCDLARACWHKHKPGRVVVGMALGWDQACARAALDVGIPFTAAIPYDGQEELWSPWQKKQYYELLKQASTVTVVCPGAYSPVKLKERNQLVVKLSDKLLALWDGDAHSGTGQCVGMATRAGKPVINQWASWVKYAKI
jgi:uncharacterized phage-like protein YoqJ